ncbi:MAG: FadR family transcriptional regulator [Desulfobacteraceae bacterium]|nr:FadR family transcriptional regulator [Desulfobacteraceae bacterium]
MLNKLEPIKSKSLQDIFVSRFEKLILSGEISIGEKLPSERELAKKMNVSRPVVHEGLIKLEAKGLVTMKPRVGSIVNDYRKKGSLSILNTLLNYGKGDLEPEIIASLLQLRFNMEVENAGLAAININGKELKELNEHIKKESNIDRDHIEDIVNLDFEFHLLIAMATHNMIYPLLINSFRLLYTNFTRRFFTDQLVITDVFNFHKKLVKAIEMKNSAKSKKIMQEMLTHGEIHLKKTIKNREN